MSTPPLTQTFVYRLTKYRDQIQIEPNFPDLITALEKEIGKNRFLFKTRITEIIQNDYSVVLSTNKGTKIRTLIVMPAISWLNIKCINFYPDIICEVRKQFPCSKNYVTSFVAEYDSAHWRLNGLSGFLLLHNPHFICYESKRNTLTGVVYHDEDYGWTVEEEIMHKFCKHFGHAAGVPVNWTQKTRQQSPIQGNYLFNMNKHLVWASADASPYYRGFLNGAVMAGQRSAIFALLSIRPQLIDYIDINMVQPAAVVRPSIPLYEKIWASINLRDFMSIAATIPIGIALYFVIKQKFH